MSTATFVKSDTTTQGTWYNGTTTVYGADGYGLPDPDDVLGSNNPKWPSYATVTLSGDSTFSFTDSTTNVRGLEYPPPGASNGSDPNRIATVWYSSTSFTVDINDGSNHQIALYFVDWNSTGRQEQIQITDDNNGNAVLDTRSISNFGTNGVWMVWDISGKVTITITEQAGGNAVLNGIFFDPAPAAPAVFPPFVSRPRFEPALYE